MYYYYLPLKRYKHILLQLILDQEEDHHNTEEYIQNIPVLEVTNRVVIEAMAYELVFLAILLNQHVVELLSMQTAVYHFDHFSDDAQVFD